MIEQRMRKKELARTWGVVPRTVNTWMASGLLPFTRIGNVVTFKPSEVEAALARFRVPAAGEPRPIKRRAGRINETTTAAAK